MLYYLGLVPHHIFLWMVQRVTKWWGEKWTDAFQQGGYNLKVLGVSLSSEWNDGRPSAEAVRDGLFGIFSENQYGSRKSFAISQYIVW